MTLTDSEIGLLSNSVDKDIHLYGSSFKVYIIYKEDEDQVTYSIKLQKYKKKIESIQGAQKKLMTLGDLQEILNRN